MATSEATRAPAVHDNGARAGNRALRLVTETKAAFKTTEFFMVVAAVVGILISAMVIKGGDTGGTDEFIARQAWLYVAIVVGAYTIGRGLAKAGTPEPYTDDDR
jgi:hypothetical protein